MLGSTFAPFQKEQVMYEKKGAVVAVFGSQHKGRGKGDSVQTGLKTIESKEWLLHFLIRVVYPPSVYV